MPPLGDAMQSGQQPNYGELLKNEYSSKQSWFELKQSLQRSRSAMPFFTKCLLLCRLGFYWVSWFTSMPNSFIINDAALMYGENELWRLILSPLLVTSFWFDLTIVMPFWLCFFCYVREFQRGTATSLLYFNLINIALQLTSLPLAYLASQILSEMTYADILSKECAFFNIFVVDLYQAMLANPNKPIDLLFCTVPQKYFALIVLFFANIVLPYDYVSILAVLIVGTTLHLTRNVDLLNPTIAKVERAVGCGRTCNMGSIGYITADEGKQNATSCTDHYVPFNRKQVKGHVRNSPAYRQRVAEFEANHSLLASTSRSTSSASGSSAASGSTTASFSGGSSLGGSTTQRSQSKLLQMRKPPATPEKPAATIEDHSMDEDNLLENDD